MSSEFVNKKIIKYALSAATTAIVPSASISTTTDIFTLAAHGLKTGDVTSVVTSNTLPTLSTGIMTATTAYYVIKITDSTFQLATSYANAVAGTYVNVTGVGVGNQTFRKNGIGVVHTGIMIPASALIMKAITNNLTNFTSGGAATVAIDSGATGILTATAYNDAGTFQAVVSHIATPLYTAAEAELVITIADAALTAGVYDLWIEYNI